MVKVQIKVICVDIQFIMHVQQLLHCDSCDISYLSKLMLMNVNYVNGDYYCTEEVVSLRNSFDARRHLSTQTILLYTYVKLREEEKKDIKRWLEYINLAMFCFLNLDEMIAKNSVPFLHNIFHMVKHLILLQYFW